MKLAYLATLAHKLLLSVIIIGGISAISYQCQIFGEEPTIEEQKLTKKEKAAVQTIDKFLAGKLSWATFIDTLTGQLESFPQYVSFCTELKNVRDPKTIPDTNKGLAIGTKLAKYLPLLPKPIKTRFENQGWNLLSIINASFNIKD